MDKNLRLAFVFLALALLIAGGGRGAGDANPVYLPFVVNNMVRGFDSQFNGDAAGWSAFGGTWQVNDHFYFGTSGPKFDVSAVHTSLYPDFDYSAQMIRYGCSSCANRLYVRGTPNPMVPGGDWTAYYSFQYNNNGYFSVWKRVRGVVKPEKNWTASDAINHGEAMNTLRVVASGTEFQYYINNVLVWDGKITGNDTGQVGLGFYNGATADTMFVNWATLK